MKKEIKQVVEYLRSMPKIKAPADFMEKLQKKIEELDRPEWDQVSFDSNIVDDDEDDDELMSTCCGYEPTAYQQTYVVDDVINGVCINCMDHAEFKRSKDGQR